MNYQQRISNGLWSLGPEHLEEMIKNGVIESNQGILSFVDKNQQEKMISNKILDSPYPDGIIASEYFYENTGDALACTLLDSYVDFGSCSRYKVIEPQIIRISNNTTGKMACVWVIPDGNLNGESHESPIFSVTPAMTDIPAKSVVEFKIHFCPNLDNSFYGAQLECFVYFKSMRNFRLVQEDTLTPPWCMTPMIAGNTFPPGEDTFIPKVKFGDTRLDFPACHVDKSVYRTVRVSNAGDTPVKFSFLDQISTKSSKSMELKKPLAFAVKPRFGLLHSNESRLIVFRFAPTEQKLYENALKCFFNSSSTNSHDLQVRGEGFYSQLSFDNQNTLCFRPTCIGAVSKREFFARNNSRISVQFEVLFFIIK